MHMETVIFHLVINVSVSKQDCQAASKLVVGSIVNSLSPSEPSV